MAAQGNPNNGSGNIVWILMLVIVAALGFVGWNEWQGHHKPVNATPAVASPAPAPADSAANGDKQQNTTNPGPVLNM